MKIPSIILLALASTFTFASEELLSSKLDSVRSAYGIPGMVASYSQNGIVIENLASGVRKNGEETQISVNDKLHLGSLTKSMTATLAATFVEEGKLRWESTLEELFPAFEMHPQFKKVTLEMILAHRSGIDKGIERFEREIAELLTRTDPRRLTMIEARALVMGVVLKYAPAAGPASKHIYSNIGYILAGHILETISGKQWEVLIKERLFKPLGMSSCGFGSPVKAATQSPEQPWGHFYDERGQMKSDASDNDPIAGPAGTIHCSTTDLNSYYSMHINGFNGHNSIIKASTFKKLHTSYPGQTYTYGGWERYERSWAEGTVLTHSGSNQRHVATVWLAPRKRASYFAFTNLAGKRPDSSGISGSDKSDAAIDEIVSFMVNLTLTE